MASPFKTTSPPNTRVQRVACPVCSSSVPSTLINDHLDSGCSKYAIPASQPASQEAKTKRGIPEDPSYTMQQVEKAPLKKPRVQQPLAERLRPVTLEDYVGQEELVGKGGLLRILVEQDRIPSLILWGPPGTGKTSLAKIIAHRTKSTFKSMSAITSGIADVKKILDTARGGQALTGKRMILFMDEVHRFNRAQQDVFLPYVESGEITLIGATTENPSFKLNGALLSRCRVFSLKALDTGEIQTVLRRAVRVIEEEDPGRTPVIEPEVIQNLAAMSDGDARVALNALEMAVQSVVWKEGEERPVLGTAQVKECLKRAHSLYDRTGDQHYGTASAFIKSMRGSDPDAALYWLHRSLEGGEDPLFLARRMVIFASEDVGMADNQALPLAIAAQQAVLHIGLPEAKYALSHAALYLAEAPKSVRVNRAMHRAMEAVQKHGALPIPMHIQNAPTKMMKEMGYHKGYLYPPDHQDDPDLAHQTYLPDALVGESFVDAKNKHL